MAKNQELSYDTKTLLTVLLLIFVYPIGVLLMYRWMNWSKVLKFILALPIWLIAFALVLVIILSATSTINPNAQLEKAQEQSTQAN